MVSYYSSNPMQIDFLQLEMDKHGIVYDVIRKDVSEPYLVVDGIPLDYERAFKWIESRG